MKLTNYIDCITLTHLKRHELEKKYFKLLQDYEELENITIKSYDAYCFIALAFLIGLLIPFIFIEMGVI